MVSPAALDLTRRNRGLRKNGPGLSFLQELRRNLDVAQKGGLGLYQIGTSCQVSIPGLRIEEAARQREFEHKKRMQQLEHQQQMQQQENERWRG